MSDNNYNSKDSTSVQINTTWSGALSGALTLRFNIMGGIFAITWSGISGSVGTPGNIIADYILPAIYRPTITKNFLYSCKTGGLESIGLLQLEPSGGLFFYADVALGNFTGTSEIFPSGITVFVP